MRGTADTETGELHSVQTGDMDIFEGSRVPEFQVSNDLQFAAFDFLAVAGSFPNEAVVKLAAEKLKAEEGKPVDPAQVPCAPKCNTSGDSFFCKLSKRSDLR